MFLLKGTCVAEYRKTLYVGHWGARELLAALVVFVYGPPRRRLSCRLCASTFCYSRNVPVLVPDYCTISAVTFFQKPCCFTRTARSVGAHMREVCMARTLAQ